MCTTAIKALKVFNDPTAWHNGRTSVLMHTEQNYLNRNYSEQSHFKTFKSCK